MEEQNDHILRAQKKEARRRMRAGVPMPVPPEIRMEAKRRMPRLTLARLKVLAEFLKHPRRALAECQVSAQTGVKTGSVHPTLRKLEALGWLESEWESPEKKQPSYPARRFYRLTKAGRAGARAAQEARWGRHDGRPLKVGIDG